MTPEQAKKLVREAFYEQGLAGSIGENVDSALKATLRIIQGRISGLWKKPALERERLWRGIRPQLMREVDQLSNRIGEEILMALREEIDHAEEFTRGYIRAGVEGATEAGVKAARSSSTTVGIASAEPFNTTVLGADLEVTTGRTYFEAISRAEVAGQNFRKVFGTSIDPTGGILTVGREDTGFARFFMTTIDRTVTQGILTGASSEEMSQELIFDSIRSGLNLGRSGKLLKANAMTAIRTGVADALNRAHEAFWEANNDWEWTDDTGERRSGKLIVGYLFDALTDSRACPECAMYDQKMAKNLSDLPTTPLHPRCRCIRRPITEGEQALIEEDRKNGKLTGGTGVQLYEAHELPGRRKGESAKDFIDRKRRQRRAQTQHDRDVSERWYARPVRRDGKVFYRVSRDLPAEDGTGVRRVPEWLAKTNRTTQVEFFGGSGAGLQRYQIFQRLIKGGTEPREALNKLLKPDQVDGFTRYTLKKLKDVKDLGA